MLDKRDLNNADDSQQRYQAILESAARVICARGYDGASMQEIAEACGMTKAGLYHHIETKEKLLVAIMNYGMDLFEDQVIAKVIDIADPVERLKACMAKNIKLVTSGSSKEVTIILHEHNTLTGHSRKEMDARKKKYVRFLESTISEAIRRGQIRRVDSTLAAFAFLGSVLWMYKWFRQDGALSEEQVAAGMVDLFFRGLMPGRQ
ncbi:MAG TPA: TetR/AcrR family transcriptional regulator [Myxococcaceae bacterium]|nr:TetR/AcrR family transcriptional regulator [Myxococcaceae bacterium]